MNSQSIILGIFIFCSLETFAQVATNCQNADVFKQTIQLKSKEMGLIIDKSNEKILIFEACSLDGQRIWDREVSANTLLESLIKGYRNGQGKLQTKDLIAKWKISYIRDSLPRVIEKRVLDQMSPTVSKNLTNAIVNDATKRAIRMADSGMPLAEIANLSQQYENAAVQSGYSLKGYKAMKNSLEKVIVNVTFQSDPVDATVELRMGAEPLGKTSFTKGLDSERSYIFVFKKEGYETTELSRYLPALPKEQTLPLVTLPKENSGESSN